MKQAFLLDQRAERLDKAIAAALPTISRRRARQLIADGAVFVDGERCRVASRSLFPGARIIVHTEVDSTPEVPEVPVLFEDDDVVVIDKPAGVHVNETETNPGRSLEWILSERKVHVVHRLDLDTTGVLLFAKRKDIARDLSQAFAAREVQKTYVAVVSGRPPEGLIDAPIGPDKRRPRARRVIDTGKPSRTEVSIVAEAHGVTAVVAKPETGRTHQIRVHLAHVKTPIVGDLLYGGPAALRADDAVVHAERPWLHARVLEVTIRGAHHRFEAPIPPDLLALEAVGLSFRGVPGVASSV